MRWFEAILYEQGIGSDIGPDAVRLVVLGRFFHHLKLLIRDEERLTVRSSEEIVQAIRDLFDRNQIKNKDVVIRVHGRGIRYFLFNTPHLAEAALPAYITKEISRRLPPGMTLPKCQMGWHVTQRNEQGFSILVAYAQTGWIEEAIQILHQAGLQPRFVGAFGFDTLSAFATDPAFFEGLRLYLICEHDEIILTVLRNGQIREAQTIETHSVEWKEELQRLVTQWRKTNEGKTEVLLTGEQAEIVHQDLQTILPDMVMASPLRGVSQTGLSLPDSYALSAGLAMKALYPELNTLDLTPGSLKREAVDRDEKKKGFRWLLLAGAGLFVLMLIMNLGQWIAGSILTRSEDQMLEMNDRIFAVELAEKEQAQLGRDLKEMKALVTERSNTAELLHEIGKLVPEKIWLSRISMGPPKEKTADQRDQILVNGWSLKQEDIADYISRLEASSLFKEIRLIETEKIDRDDVYELSKAYRKSVVRFTILLK